MKTILLAGLIYGSLLPVASHAVLITLGGPPEERSASLSSAVSGATGSGNATATDVLAAYLGAAWTEVAERTSGSGTTGAFTVALTSGSWGGQPPIVGTWGIDSSFWSTYGEAAISMHVGNGNGEPDHFIWLITPNTLAGSWNYIDNTGGGGGLSNLKLYGRGVPTNVPDGGATIALFGLALLGVGGVRKMLGSRKA